MNEANINGCVLVWDEKSIIHIAWNDRPQQLFWLQSQCVWYLTLKGKQELRQKINIIYII